MNERMRAIEVLQQAKETLARRLTEQVLEAAEEILADARGESYMNDIETVYEQIGIKLAHVNQMLSNLPAPVESPHTTTAAAQHDPHHMFTMNTETPSDADAVIVTDTTAALPGPVFVAAPALPAPGKQEPASELPPPRSFQAFAAHIQAGDLLAAGRSLANLLELEESRAIACAAVFADRLRRDPGFLRRTMQLRSELAASGSDRALTLLGECFGLHRDEATMVLKALRRRLNLDR